MATLVRRVLKVLLFLGLFYLSFRLVRPYNTEWTEGEANFWWRIADSLGVRDPELLYIGLWVTIELLVSVGVYIAIMKLWRHCQRCRSRA